MNQNEWKSIQNYVYNINFNDYTIRYNEGEFNAFSNWLLKPNISERALKSNLACVARLVS